MRTTQGRDARDLLGGILLMALGVAAALYAARHYPIGELSRMGPGMFPAALGWLLVGLGAAIALPAWFRSGTVPRPALRPFSLCLAGVLIFAVAVERIGVVPSIFLLTAAAALADDKLGIVGTLALASFLSVAVVAIFLYGLGIPIHPFAWSW